MALEGCGAVAEVAVVGDADEGDDDAVAADEDGAADDASGAAADADAAVEVADACVVDVVPGGGCGAGGTC